MFQIPLNNTIDIEEYKKKLSSAIDNCLKPIKGHIVQEQFSQSVGIQPNELVNFPRLKAYFNVMIEKSYFEGIRQILGYFNKDNYPDISDEQRSDILYCYISVILGDKITIFGTQLQSSGVEFEIKFNNLDFLNFLKVTFIDVKDKIGESFNEFQKSNHEISYNVIKFVLGKPFDEGSSSV